VYEVDATLSEISAKAVGQASCLSKKCIFPGKSDRLEAYPTILPAFEEVPFRVAGSAGMLPGVVAHGFASTPD
jgi:hypothetical protein